MSCAAALLIDSWLAQADPILRLRGYKALAEASEQPEWEDRAFTILAQLIETSVIEQPKRDRRLCACARWTRRASQSRGAHRLWRRLDRHAAVQHRAGRHGVECGDYACAACIRSWLRRSWLNEPRLILESPDIEARFEPARVGELTQLCQPRRSLCAAESGAGVERHRIARSRSRHAGARTVPAVGRRLETDDADFDPARVGPGHQFDHGRARCCIA